MSVEYTKDNEKYLTGIDTGYAVSNYYPEFWLKTLSNVLVEHGIAEVSAFYAYTLNTNLRNEITKVGGILCCEDYEHYLADIPEEDRDFHRKRPWDLGGKLIPTLLDNNYYSSEKSPISFTKTSIKTQLNGEGREVKVLFSDWADTLDKVRNVQLLRNYLNYGNILVVVCYRTYASWESITKEMIDFFSSNELNYENVYLFHKDKIGIKFGYRGVYIDPSQEYPYKSYLHNEPSIFVPIGFSENKENIIVPFLNFLHEHNYQVTHLYGAGSSLLRVLNMLMAIEKLGGKSCFIDKWLPSRRFDPRLLSATAQAFYESGVDSIDPFLDEINNTDQNKHQLNYKKS